MNLNDNIKKRSISATHTLVISVSFCMLSGIAVAGDKKASGPSIAPSAGSHIESTISPSAAGSLQTKNMGTSYSTSETAKSVGPTVEKPRIQVPENLKNQSGKSGIVGPSM